MTAWRLAPSLVFCFQEFNSRYPNRDRASDGSIGDSAHAARNSDHNPDSRGIVHAIDVDEDVHGIDSEAGNELQWWVDWLIDSREHRLKYVIYEGKICSGHLGPSPWIWRTYNGINPHRRHVHISIYSTFSAENDLRTWFPPATIVQIEKEDDDMHLLATPHRGIWLLHSSGALHLQDTFTVSRYEAAGVPYVFPNDPRQRHFDPSECDRIIETFATPQRTEMRLAAIQNVVTAPQAPDGG